ncbi:E3 ubiquitin-protein ligase TRIM68-like [Trichomycterus rosablanca]|uniref:E3 ubiquitin-protein ligase TRIM68-like n=1 Tax=Trichomycterus rosablanca TaxID=2290929 RepID=UPI002F34FBD3
MAESSPPRLRRDRSNSMDVPPKFTRDSSNILSENQLLCLICLDVFTDPVTTPCGHNFCRSCLTQHWDKSPQCHCPICKEKFTKRPELKINTTLREVADHFKKKSEVDKPEVLCDVCNGMKQKALKSCLDCGVTFCESHLELHINVPKYKKHKLINPVKNLEKYRCQKHEKPLERFCRDDQICVCQWCIEADHKNHNIIPIEEEINHKKTQLGQTQTEVQQMIQDRLKKIKEINHSVELSKKNTEKEKSDSIKTFTDLIHSIEKSQTEMLKMMEEKQKVVENQAERFIKDLEQEITELQRRETKLEKLLNTEEHLNILQVYPTICSPPTTKNWTDISINTDPDVETLRTSLSQLQKTLDEKLNKTLDEKLDKILDEKLDKILDEMFRETGEKFPTELKRIQQYAVDVTLDPDTANPYLVLSDDGKQVTYGNTNHNLPDTPKRFSRYCIILGKQSCSSGRFYYEVQVSGNTEWNLGVARESVNRKDEIILRPQDGLWTVILRNREYKACADPSVLLSLKEKPQKVGVFVDYEEGLVSFYDVENRVHIYSYTGQMFTEKLFPYFSPGNNDGGKNSAPLIINPVIKIQSILLIDEWED